MMGKKLFKVKNSVSIKRLWAMLVVLCMLAAMVPVSAEDTTATDIGGVELLENAVSSSINLKTCTVSADMKNVWVDVNIYNADSEEKNGILIFKADNSNNEFYVSTKPITVSASAETPAQIAINGLENKASAYNMKLYLWGKDNLEPITEVGVIPTINDINTNVSVAARSGAELEDVRLLDTLVANVSDSSVTSRQWQVSTDAGTTWTDIAGETSAEYIVSAAQSGAKVRCVAKMDNNTNIASAAVDVPNYTVNATGAGVAAPGGTVDTTPAADKFTVDGKGFVLLDTFDNDESTYYVTTTDAYGDMQLLTADQWWVFTSNKQINQDAYNSNAFLNGDFLTNGNNFSALGSDTTTYYKLPQGIIENINKNHVWWRFVNDHKKKNEGVRSTYQTGVSLLSWTDFTTYAGKLGVKDVFNDSNVNKNANGADIYFLRDTNNWGGDNALALFYATDTEKKCVHWGQNDRPYGLLRPAFYLKKDFFKTTSIDLAAAGASVISAIKANCKDEELLRLYGSEACETYFGIDSAIKVTTSVRSGAELANVKLLDTLVASVDGGAATEYKWQMQTSTGDWNDIEGETSAEYIVSAAQAGAKVSCAAKVNDKWYYSAAVAQIPNYTVNATGDGAAAPGGTVDTTPADYKFTVDGKGFVLLDTFDNDESTYYVTTTDAYGDMQLLTADQWWVFTSNKQINQDAYNSNAFLNGDFLTNGNNFSALGSDTTTYYKLPQGIIENINKNHVWWRFVNDHKKKNEGVRSTYQTGVSLLSWTDFTTYAGKLGVKDVFNDSNVNKNANGADIYFLRDTNNWGGDNALALFYATDTEKKCVHWGQNVRPNGLLRPAFYLKKDFFKTTSIDLATAGANVISAIKANCTQEELLALYGAEACETYLGITGTVKFATSLRAGKDIAAVQVLDTLVASAQSESGEQATGYQWQVYKDRSWNNIVVPTSTLNELVITADLAGAEVRCTAKVDEKTIYGSAIKIPEKISLNPNNDSEDGYAEYTPNKYMFTVGGKNFVLLDAFDNSQSTYYVTTKESYGDLQTLASRAEGANNDNPTGKQINYDSSKTTEFLNGDFLINGNKYNALGKDNTTYKKLPDDIINYINRDHIWWRYVNDYRKNNGVQSTYKAGVSLLSWTDFKTYAGKFGISEVFEDADVNGGSAQMYYLRDTNGWGGDPSVTAIVRADGYHRAVYKIASDSGCGYGLLRPAFYLKEDFFKNVKLDFDTTGESVLDIMRGRYSVEDLASIYTVAELEAKGFRHQGVNSSATLKIESDEVGNIFTDADDVKIRINSSNSDISYRVTDYDGNVVKSGTTNPIWDFAELDFNSLDVGYYELAVQNNSAFNDSAEKTLTSFAIIPEFDFSQVQNSPFGINTHFELNWLGWDIKTIPLLKKAGVKSIRDGYYWGSMEQEKGKYENYWFFPNEQARLRLAGIDYLYCTAGENTLYDGGTYPYTGEGITGFANFSKKAAELFNHKYGDYKLNYMDMYNEWYNKWDETTDFINVFREVYQTVKGSYPDMTLFLGIGANEKFNNILNAGALDYCDGYEIHPYNWHAKVEDPENPDVGLAKQIDQTREMVDNHNTSNKDLKFWITETGWPTIKVKYDTVEYDITDEEQANYLVRAYAIALSKGVERVYWYDFTNDRNRNHVYEDDYFEHKENGEYNFGLIRNGFDGRYGAHTPKRSYVAYANLTRELANKSFVNLAENNNGTGTTYYYNFADSNGAKTAIACYVVLDGTNTDPSVSVNIKADEAVTVKNIEGKVIKTAQAGETFTLSVSAEPIYIEGGYTVQ